MIIEEYGNIKLNDLLYDNTVNIYTYQQYKEHPGIEYIFNYFDIKMKQMRELIYVWLLYKSNQKIPEDIGLSQEYFTYLVKWYYGLPDVFGIAKNKYQWDQTAPVIQWDEKDIKWDEFSSTGVLDVNKVKALFRLIQNINQVQFRIEDFIKFCNDFCYLAKHVDIYVDDSSFINPEEIHIYYTHDSEQVVELQKVITIFKDILPMYSIKLQLKSFRKRKKNKKKDNIQSI